MHDIYAQMQLHFIVTYLACVLRGAGTNVTVSEVSVFGCGSGGVFLDGGDRPSLTPSNHSLIDSGNSLCLFLSASLCLSGWLCVCVCLSLSSLSLTLSVSDVRNNSRWVYAMCPAVFLGGVNQVSLSVSLSIPLYLSLSVSLTLSL